MSNKKPNQRLISKYFTKKNFLFFLTIIFMAGVIYYLYRNLSEIKWGLVKNAIIKISNLTLLKISCVVTGFYSILSFYDYFSMRYLKIDKHHKLTSILRISFISYTFNLNLGALIGGIGIRYQLFMRINLVMDQIFRVIFLSTLTNWTGYLFLSGILLIFRSQFLSSISSLPLSALEGVGFLIVIGLIIYIWSSLTKKRIYFRGKEWSIPDIKFIFYQILISSAQWSLQGLTLYIILKSFVHEISFAEVLMTLIFSSFIAVLVHIPGGLGVLEVVLLHSFKNISRPEILVSIIIYRIFAYFIPLCIALGSYSLIALERKKIMVK